MSHCWGKKNAVEKSRLPFLTAFKIVFYYIYFDTNTCGKKSEPLKSEHVHNHENIFLPGTTSASVEGNTI